MGETTTFYVPTLWPLVQWCSTVLVERNPKDVSQWLEEPLFHRSAQESLNILSIVAFVIFLVEALKYAGGTLGFRETQVENHCFNVSHLSQSYSYVCSKYENFGRLLYFFITVNYF